MPRPRIGNILEAGVPNFIPVAAAASLQNQVTGAQQAVTLMSRHTTIHTPSTWDAALNSFIEPENVETMYGLATFQYIGHKCLQGSMTQLKGLLIALLLAKTFPAPAGIIVARTISGFALGCHIKPHDPLEDSEKIQLTWATFAADVYVFTCQGLDCLIGVYPHKM